MAKQKATDIDAGSEIELDGPDRSGQRSIQSVEVGFRLIKALDEASDALSLKRLAAAAGMTASKAHLYLVSFRRVGLVVQESDSGRYALGPYALQLGLSALRKLEVVRLARDTLGELSEATGESCYIAVWGNRGPCITSVSTAPGSLPLLLQVGYVLPTTSTATGRIFLSYLPRTHTEQVVSAERALSWSGANGEAAIRRIIEEVRAHGISHTDGQLSIGLAAFSVPVFAHDGAVTAAITVIGSSATMDATIEGPIARRLQRAARNLSAQLGWSGGVE